MRLELVLDGADLPWRPTAEWEAATRALLEAWGPVDGILQCVLTDDPTVRELNRDYRGKDRPTDVLSFPYLEGHESQRERLLRGDLRAEEFAGDPREDEDGVLVGQILVSLPFVWERGALHASDLPTELRFLLVHGFLHVLGYDHVDDREAEIMEELEMELMRSDPGLDGGDCP